MNYALSDEVRRQVCAALQYQELIMKYLGTSLLILKLLIAVVRLTLVWGT
jgi:hypothetical protein